LQGVLAGGFDFALAGRSLYDDYLDLARNNISTISNSHLHHHNTLQHGGMVNGSLQVEEENTF